MGKIIPFRSAPKHAGTELSSNTLGSDLLWLGSLLWCASALRVILAVLEREVFRAEATLALLCLALLPWSWLQSRVGRRRSGAGTSRLARASPDAQQARR